MNASTTLSTASNPTIALVAPSLEILGGQGVQASALATALIRDGYNVRFVPINPTFPKGLRWVRRIPYLRTCVNQLLYIPSLHKLRHVDVVHVFSASYWSFLLAPVPAILAARLLKKRVILNYHSGEADSHLTGWGIRVHPWLKLVDDIVVPSPYLKNVFADHGYETSVIRNIINTSHFRYREREPLRPRLLSARNLEPHYGINTIIDAYALVKERFPDATLTVVGYGSEESRLRQQVRELGLDGVDFVGRLEPEAMPALYDSADIFLNASVVDNQPVSILEAFSAGLNVISTPTGDIPAMVRDGITGDIVHHNDPAAMADKVQWLLEHQDEAARRRVQAYLEVKKYTWPYVSMEWSGLFMRRQC